MFFGEGGTRFQAMSVVPVKGGERGEDYGDCYRGDIGEFAAGGLCRWCDSGTLRVAFTGEFCCGEAVGFGVASGALEVGTEVGGALVAEVAVFLHRLVDGVLEIGGNVGVEADGFDGFAIYDFVEDGAGGVAFEGEKASGHFVEDDAEGKKIGARVEGFAEDLLGGHVGDGAESAAGAGEVVRIDGICADGCYVRAVQLGGDFGEAEVEDFGVAAFGDEDVGGFYVAVNDAFCVSGVQGVGDFDAEVEEAFELHRLGGDDVLEGGAFEKFHGDEATAIVFGDFVDGADVGVIKRGCGAGFAAEALEGGFVLLHFLWEKFEGDEAAELRVFGFVDNPHASTTDFLDDAVMGNSLSDKRIITGHSGVMLGCHPRQVNESSNGASIVGKTRRRLRTLVQR